MKSSSAVAIPFATDMYRTVYNMRVSESCESMCEPRKDRPFCIIYRKDDLCVARVICQTWHMSNAKANRRFVVLTLLLPGTMPG